MRLCKWRRRDCQRAAHAALVSAIVVEVLSPSSGPSEVKPIES